MRASDNVDMPRFTGILGTLPLEETARPGERVYPWGDERAVILLDSDGIGQFAIGGR